MSDASATHHPRYLAVWLWLVGLVLLSVGASRTGLPHPVVWTIVFGGAVVKAILVMLYFMHLRWAHVLVVGAVLAPLALFVILTVSLVPDFVWALAPH